MYSFDWVRFQQIVLHHTIIRQLCHFWSRQVFFTTYFKERDDAKLTVWLNWWSKQNNSIVLYPNWRKTHNTSLSLFLSLFFLCCISLSFSLSLTHTHTHLHAHFHTNTHTQRSSEREREAVCVCARSHICIKVQEVTNAGPNY